MALLEELPDETEFSIFILGADGDQIVTLNNEMFLFKSTEVLD